MGPKTIKRLAILISVVLVAGLAIFFIQRYQVTRMAQLVLDDAERAERDGDFDEAARIYQERLAVIPDDAGTKLKLADVLRKGTKTAQRLEQAAQIYGEILSRDPGNKEVHHRLAELAFELGRYNPPPASPSGFVGSTTQYYARPHLELLLKVDKDGELPKKLSEPLDGGLCFLLGRCQEAAGDYVGAVESYRAAIANDAPQKIEASRRLATLLRIPGKQQDLVAAKQVIDKMVSADPNNYQVYLERGRYLHQPPSTPEDRKAASADFQRALKIVPADSQIYLELASLELDARPPNFEAARSFLSAGLAVAPKDPSLHLAMASLERHTGSIDKAITSLRKSLEVLPDNVSLHLMLVELLVDQGNTTDLLLQIEDLKRLNVSPVFVDFYDACYQVNSGEWTKARQMLVRLQALFESRPEYRSRVDFLLARCYSHLNDKERQHDALVEAIRANPQNGMARLQLAESLAARGEIDQAIAEYEKLVARAPGVRDRLVGLLIRRNQQRPAEERNWKKIEELIDQVAGSAPTSAEPLIMRNELLVAQGKLTDAQTLLDQARQRFPKEVAIWRSSVDLLRLQGKLDQAQSLLDQAQTTLGDSADLELARVRLLFAKGEANLPKMLGDLAQKSRAFAPADRRRLIEALAPGAARLGDLTLAKSLWSEMAALDPNDLGPRLQLLNLARQAGNEDDIKQIIADIKQIDGIDGLIGRYQDIYDLIWRAQKSTDQNAKQTLRNNARLHLRELSSRRPNWSLIPLALAEIGEQELRDLEQEKQDLAASSAKTTAAQTQQRTLKAIEDDEKSKADEMATLYLQAIDLGQRNLLIVRRATDLLYRAKRDAEVSQLWSQLPAGSIVGSTLQSEELYAAIRNQDFKLAADLATKAVEAHPNDFLEQLFLARLLNAKGGDGPAQAVAVLRKGINLAPGDPDRRLKLVRFLVETGQVDKAETAVSEAQAALPANQVSTLLSLAQCGAAIGMSYQKTGDKQKVAKWYSDATAWYEKAQRAKPDDPLITREMTQFLLSSGQISKVKDQLATILKQSPNPANADELAWARRMLAQTLLASKQTVEALKLVEPIAQALAVQGPESKPTQKPEDLFVLAKVYESQNTPLYKKKALETLERLVAVGTLTSLEVRFMLARLYYQNGDWTKARDQFRALIAQTENRRDFEALSHRPDYIAQFIIALLKRFHADQDQEALTEAQELIGKLKVARPDNVVVVGLEAQILKAQKQTDKAVELIQTSAALPKQTSDARLALALVAEELGELGLAEQLFRQLALQADQRNRLALAQFLSRQGRVKDALDLLELIWKEANGPEKDRLVRTLLETLLLGKTKADSTQVERVANWMQNALDSPEQQPKSSALRVGLANLRERQKQFEAAKALYSQEIAQSGGDWVALNNLAWLTILNDANQGSSALSMINRAMDRGGPLPELLDTRGVIYLKAGDFQHAIADLNKAAADDPKPARYFHLAQAYLGAKNKEAAKQNWDKALEIGLKEESLHPLEAGTYKEVLSALEVR